MRRRMAPQQAEKASASEKEKQSARRAGRAPAGQPGIWAGLAYHVPARGKPPADAGSDEPEAAASDAVAPRDVHDVLASAGEPLDPSIRATAEARIGQSLPDVTVHRDERAMASAQAIEAGAYTVGRHVVLGEHAARSPFARSVLHHELAHVAQQAPLGDALPSVLRLGPTHSPLERAADSVARGRSSAVGRAASVHVQRNPPPAHADPETDRLGLPGVSKSATTGPYASIVTGLQADLAAATSFTAAQTAVETRGLALWNQATTNLRGATSTNPPDDTSVYWARLHMRDQLQQYSPSAFTLSSTQRDTLLARLEDTSRGLTSSSFSAAATAPGSTIKRILVSGFDPFSFTSPLSANNVSGAVAMALDGQTVSNGTIQGEIQGVVFPVRFSYFNAGNIETFFQPFITGSNPAHMILTISLDPGTSTDFSIEQYAARARTTGAADNMGAMGGTSTSGVVSTPGAGKGGQFIATSLPVTEMKGATVPSGSGFVLQNRRTFSATDSSGTTIDQSTAPSAVGQTGTSIDPTALGSGYTATDGSGGNYLSNEIFYRTRQVETAAGSSVRGGHLHVPQVSPKKRAEVIATVKAMIEAALPRL